jgi:hypothetical protein
MCFGVMQGERQKPLFMGIYQGILLLRIHLLSLDTTRLNM